MIIIFSLKKESNYFIIILILFSNYYLWGLYNFFNDKLIVKSLFLLFSLILLYNNKKNINFSVRTFLLIIFSVLIKSHYLSFFVIFISAFLERNKRLKYVLFISLFFYILTLVLNYLGFLDIQNDVYSHFKTFLSYKIHRKSLGFFHPNIAMFMLLPIFFGVYYLYYPKFKFQILIMILSSSLIIFSFTFSRTAFLLIFLFILLLKIKDSTLEKFKKVFYFQGVIVALLSLILPFYLKSTILDTYFSGRLKLFYLYLTKENINFLGNKLLKYETLPLDNAFLRILYEDGYIGFIIISLLTFYVMKLLFDNKDYKAVRIFFITLLFGFMESQAFLYFFCLILYILPDYIFVNSSFNKTK